MRQYKTYFSTSILLLLAFIMTGCNGSSLTQSSSHVISETQFNKTFINEDKLRTLMSNATSHSFSPGHGTQIEFNAADGKSYLWYPGNRVILPSLWKVEPGQTITVRVQTDNGVNIRKVAVPKICYKYGSNTINRVTNERGGKWSCQNSTISRLFDVESRKGDVFGLQKRTLPPFTLERDKTSIDELLAKCSTC